eukprot:1211420-Amphidinium_carterae.1
MPLVVPQWVSHPAWAAVFVFIQATTEIENPFGEPICLGMLNSDVSTLNWTYFKSRAKGRQH